LIHSIGFSLTKLLRPFSAGDFAAVHVQSLAVIIAEIERVRAAVQALVANVIVGRRGHSEPHVFSAGNRAAAAVKTNEISFGHRF
jgi:hypothetical protein